MAVDHAGGIFMAVGQRGVVAIEKVTSTGDVATVFRERAGHLGGPLSCVSKMAVAPDGSIYLADRFLGQVTRIDRSGTVAVDLTP